MNEDDFRELAVTVGVMKERMAVTDKRIETLESEQGRQRDSHTDLKQSYTEHRTEDAEKWGEVKGGIRMLTWMLGGLAALMAAGLTVLGLVLRR